MELRNGQKARAARPLLSLHGDIMRHFSGKRCDLCEHKPAEDQQRRPERQRRRERRLSRRWRIPAQAKAYADWTGPQLSNHERVIIENGCVRQIGSPQID